MRPDLLEAFASVEWAFGKLPDLAQRLEAWLNSSVIIETRNVPPPAEYNPIVAVEKELLPLSFNVEVGAYINAIRSGLDILAFALVRRYNLDIPEDRVMFPIARSEETFRNRSWQGRPFLEALPARDREIIETLKPYQGGSAGLWTLHHLDIVRKHRRLLTAVLRPISISLQGTLKPDDFKPLPTEIHVNEETVIPPPIVDKLPASRIDNLISHC
jgi:hypothetical protein